MHWIQYAGFWIMSRCKVVFGMTIGPSMRSEGRLSILPVDTWMSSPKSPVWLNQTWYRASGQWFLLRFCSSESAPQSGLETIDSQIGIFDGFDYQIGKSLLVKNYQAIRNEINMGRREHDQMSSCARYGDWTLRRCEDSRGLLFWQWHKIVFSQSTCSIHLLFDIRAIRPCQVLFPSESASC